ncbi:MAG: hypothetical protein J4G13_04270 [Dehalococcoidia bacterium]|nr:hypothetical protein [Dehalococcoidia bacterium]
MDRARHLESARDFLAALAVLETIPRQSQAVAEMVWGATVAAMSAADPEHFASHHFAPNQRWSFLQVAQRIANPGLTLSELEHCLNNNQGLLHTHFYHGNLEGTDFLLSVSDGVSFVSRIITLAERSIP